MSRKSKASSASLGTAASIGADATADADIIEDGPDGQLPLLDEVSNLLQKERTLMGLRVLEKEAEAIDWRTKYETLVSKLSDGGAGTAVGDAARGLEFAAELDAASSAPMSAPDFRARVMQALREDKATSLDLAGANVGLSGVSEVLKILRAMKKTTSLRTICLKNSNLDSTCSEQAAALFSFPFLEGLDLSYNSLGRNFLSSLITTLELRRKSPQYIVLSCNPELSDQSLAPVLAHLSSDVWGLVVSANDSPPGLQGAAASTKTKAPPPQRCAYEFLRSLNARMASSSQRRGEVMAASEEPKKKNKGDNKDEAAIIGVRRGGISTLSVLGIVHSTISKVSIKLLEETLQLTAASLTDLDLSFCMIGYRGVEMLQKALSNPHSQVIRLGLRGNCITDAAVPLLGKMIESSQTLIHIDLGANMITSAGLTQLTKSIKKNFILYSIRLCGNPIGVQSIAAAQDALQKEGCSAILKFTDAIVDAGSSGPGGLSSSYRDGALFYSAKMITTTLQPDPRVIFKIPVKNVQIKEAIHFDPEGEDAEDDDVPKRPKHIGSLLVRWKMRVRTSDAIAAMERDPSAFKANKTNIFAPIEWEITHCSAIEKRSIYCSTDFGRSPFVPNNDEWIICEAIVPQVPLLGHLEIAIRRIDAAHTSSHNDASEEGSRGEIKSKRGDNKTPSSFVSSTNRATISSPPIYVEAYDLCVSIHDNPLHPTPGSAGSDVAAWNGMINQSVSTSASVIATLPSSNTIDNMRQTMLYSRDAERSGGSSQPSSIQSRTSDGFPLPDHTILRILSWPGPGANDAKLTFAMKLTNLISGGSSAHDNGLGRLKNAHFGYEWTLTVYRSHGALERPIRGSILPHSETIIPQDSLSLVSYEDTGSYASVNLMPWSWRAWTVTLPLLRVGDRVFLTARVLTEGGVAPSVNNAISVGCQHVSFDFLRTTANGDWLVPGTEEAALFVVQNDPNLVISL